MAQEKEYTGSMIVGATTPTYDLESVPIPFASIDSLTEEKIYAATGSFKGEILQVPPIHSAIKKQGIRAYELARQGNKSNLKQEKSISAILTLQAFSYQSCSSG